MMEPVNIDQDILNSPAPTSNYQEIKLCIIIDSRTPIIMKIPMPAEKITLGQFKKFTSLKEEHYKFYFKSQDSEFGVVKEEVAEDECSLPADGGRIVAWVISKDTNNSSLFELETTQHGLNDNYIINHKTVNSSYDGSSHFLPSNQGTHSKDLKNEDIVYIRVQLNLDCYNFLGLTLVGPSDEIGLSDGGIHVGEIARNSVVEQDGRIEIGDRVVEINGLDVRQMKNDDAVAIFRSCLDQRGAITLILQRNLKMSSYNKGRFTLPREYANAVNYHTSAKEPRQIREDLPTSTLTSHEGYQIQTSNIHHRNQRLNRPNNRTTHSLPRSITPSSLYATSNFENLKTNKNSSFKVDSRSVYEPTTPTSIRQFDIALHCGRDDIQTIYAALKSDAKSLDIKDREWLKVIVKNAFIGSVLVKWLIRNVYGFGHKREVKRFANQMLILGLIRNPITGGVFSEKCYYTLS